MIRNDFKKCCESCEHLNLDYDQDPIYSWYGERDVYLRIGCAHQNVCERYLNEMMPHE